MAIITLAKQLKIRVNCVSGNRGVCFCLTICCARLIGIGNVPGWIVMVCMLAGKPELVALVVTLARDPNDAGLMTCIILSPSPPSIVKNLAGFIVVAFDTPGDVMVVEPSSRDITTPSGSWQKKQQQVHQKY